MPLAVGIGVLGAGISLALLDMIGFSTNLFCYQRLSVHLVSPNANTLGAIAVVIPVVGGLIVGQLGASALALLFVVKLVIWSGGLGRGTSRGILAPILMMGVALGGVFGHPPDPVQRSSRSVRGAGPIHRRQSIASIRWNRATSDHRLPPR